MWWEYLNRIQIWNHEIEIFSTDKNRKYEIRAVLDKSYLENSHWNFPLDQLEASFSGISQRQEPTPVRSASWTETWHLTLDTTTHTFSQRPRNDLDKIPRVILDFPPNFTDLCPDFNNLNSESLDSRAIYFLDDVFTYYRLFSDPKGSSRVQYLRRLARGLLALEIIKEFESSGLEIIKGRVFGLTLKS